MLRSAAPSENAALMYARVKHPSEFSSPIGRTLKFPDMIKTDT
jgi:hypothetical protein